MGWDSGYYLNIEILVLTSFYLLIRTNDDSISTSRSHNIGISLVNDNPITNSCIIIYYYIMISYKQDTFSLIFLTR